MKMDNLKIKNRTKQLKQETFETLQKLTQNNLKSSKTTFENLINTLNSNAKNDEKFVLMLISMLHKKCSSELLLALLYIIS